MNTLARRIIPAGARPHVHRQAFAGGRVPILEGYALVWGELSTDRGGHFVRLARNSATFANPTLALYSHDAGKILGSTANGTLRILPADDIGVPVEIDLSTILGHWLAGQVGRERWGWSWKAAVVTDHAESIDAAGRKIVTIRQCVISEVTITDKPSFAGTFVRVKPAGAGLSLRAAAGMHLRRTRLLATYGRAWVSHCAEDDAGGGEVQKRSI